MAKLTVTFSGEPVGEYPLDKPASIIGRDATADIQIDNLGVSRAHCQIVKRANTFILQDMNSANGTYVNGKKVGEHYLNDGDEILVGKFLLKFDATGTAVAPEKHAAEKQPEMADALRTYVVDGTRIRERLAGMHSAETERQAAAEGGPDMATPAPEPRQVGLPGPPPAPRRAMDHALGFDPLKPRSRPGTQHLRQPLPVQAGGTSVAVKVLLIMSVLINLVLIVLVVALVLMMNQMRVMMDRNAASQPGGAGAPAPAAAAESPSGTR